MSRSRNIKPGFFQNEDLADLAFEYRILFQGLWCEADREGRLEDRPKRLKAAIFPYDNVDVESGLQSLALAGFIVRYEVDGKRYIQILNFVKHQNPHKKEAASVIPAIPGAEQCWTIQEHDIPEEDPEITGHDPEIPEQAGLIPDSPLLIPDSLEKPERVQPLAARCRFADFWAAYPNKKGKQEAERTWKRRKLDGRCDELIGHVRLMESHDDGWRRGYVPMGSTYLNQARWEDVPQESARAGPQTGHIGRQMPKQVQGLMALEDFGNGGLDQAGNCRGPQEAHVLGPGADSGSGGYSADRRRLAGGHH
ncbi:hypothetical protein [Stenotrophomonas maltophilia]|uniref:hypothetical protein n=1 Tax=Stenotrophomonas maltophilia TaxID=40324 RepID=UPI0009C187F1|nr:hypothetical protein [Stenotrophomonas maltophilia]